MLKCYSDVIRRVKCVKPQHELLKRRTRINQIDVYSINLENCIALFAKAVSINWAMNCKDLLQDFLSDPNLHRHITI